MRRLLLLSALFTVLAAGCNCGLEKLRDTATVCERDPSLCDPPPDAGEIVDAGKPDAGRPPCTDFGSVTGRVCAPDQQTWVNGASVTVDALDCHGDPVHVSTVSGDDGTFTLDGIPNGSWVVKAESGSFTQELPVNITPGQTTEIPVNQLCVAQRQVKIAVITGIGDQIEQLLTSLNLTYDLYGGDYTRYATEAEPFLADLNKMKQYDLIFINCAAAKDFNDIDFGSRATTIQNNLKTYVAQGGSIYASDWALLFAVYAKPGQLDFLTSTGANVSSPLNTQHLMGYAPQQVTASVTDTNLAAFLGKTQIAINFPKQSGAMSLHWGLLQTVGSGVKVLVQAPSVQVCDGSASCSGVGGSATNVPLAMQLKVTPADQHGGQIIYTSFHNIAQSGNDVAQTLKYLILHL